MITEYEYLRVLSNSDPALTSAEREKVFKLLENNNEWSVEQKIDYLASSVSSEGRTFLMYLALAGQQHVKRLFDLIALWLIQDISPDVKQKLIDFVVANNHEGNFFHFIALGAQQNPITETFFIDAIPKDLTLVPLFVSLLKASNDSGSTVLHLVAKHGFENLITFGEALGVFFSEAAMQEIFAACLNSQDADGNTPMHFLFLLTSNFNYVFGISALRMFSLLSRFRKNFYVANREGIRPIDAAYLVLSPNILSFSFYMWQSVVLEEENIILGTYSWGENGHRYLNGDHNVFKVFNRVKQLVEKQYWQEAINFLSTPLSFCLTGGLSPDSNYGGETVAVYVYKYLGIQLLQLIDQIPKQNDTILYLWSYVFAPRKSPLNEEIQSIVDSVLLIGYYDNKHNEKVTFLFDLLSQFCINASIANIICDSLNANGKCLRALLGGRNIEAYSKFVSLMLLFKEFNAPIKKIQEMVYWAFQERDHASVYKAYCPRKLVDPFFQLLINGLVSLQDCQDISNEDLRNLVAAKLLKLDYDTQRKVLTAQPPEQNPVIVFLETQSKKRWFSFFMPSTIMKQVQALIHKVFNEEMELRPLEDISRRGSFDNEESSVIRDASQGYAFSELEELELKSAPGSQQKRIASANVSPNANASSSRPPRFAI